MKKLALLLIISSLFVASPVLGVHNSAGWLSECKEGVKFLNNEPCDLAKVNHCMGFIIGADQMLSKVSAANQDIEINQLYCRPFDLVTAQTIRIWVEYLENNPQELNLSPIETFSSAMTEAFPCPEPQPSK